jgi:hypothetical protein
VKPGDHPEFFRFPAPEGRSRESKIVLDRHGSFWEAGERVEHQGMARAFASWIARHPDDGRFILSNGYDWTYFQVEDAPFVVVAVRDSDGWPQVLLSDGTREPLAAKTLEVGSADALYCSVKKGEFKARFRPEAQNALAPWLQQAADGRVVLVVGGQSYTVTAQ